jgi:hypothetical protein
MRGFAAGIAALGIFAAVPQSRAIEPETVVRRAEPSIVRIVISGEGGMVVGSGVVVSRSGHVATAYHLVRAHLDNKWKIAVFATGEEPGKSHAATMVKAYPGEDLAVIKVAGLDRRPAWLSAANQDRPARGSAVFAIGYPGAGARLGAATQASFTAGAVSRLFRGAWTKDGPQILIIQHSAPINPGNSGGPIVDACGRVVGINTQREVAFFMLPGGLPVMTDVIQGVFFASHASVLIAKLKELGIDYAGTRRVCRNFLGIASIHWPLYGILAAVAALIFLGGLVLLVFRRIRLVHVVVHVGNGLRRGGHAALRRISRKRIDRGS